MSSTADSSSEIIATSSSAVPENDLSTLLDDEQEKRRLVVNHEETDQDEGITDEDQHEENDSSDNEPQIDDDEQVSPILPTTNNIPIQNPIISATNSDYYALLEGDINEVFTKIPTSFLAGASYESDIENSRLIMVTLHFFTNFIETETACQWQICNKKPLTCQILFHKHSYLDEKIVLKRVYQTCNCHPANATKVPFIERLVHDFFDKTSINMETLKYSRAAINPTLRLQYFFEILPKSKRSQYEELLTNSNDDGLVNELIAFEILDNNEKIVQKLQMIKEPRVNPSDINQHYDLLNDKKHLPTLNHGYLVQFCKYFEYRLRNLNSLCVMCGKRTFDRIDKKGLKPSICDDYECFSNAMDSKFRNDPLPPSIFSIEIADFLLLLVDAAINSTRHELILDPYPKLINPYNTSTTLIDQHGNRKENNEILQTIIKDMITMGSITQYEAVKIPLRSMLELKHPWAFSFFHWLMGTNRYHFSLIPLEYQMKSIQTNYQYFIKHEDIVKHVNFKKLRDQKGSIFAFHGSPQENWHSILRSGLQIGKGGYLLHGAAYGAGVYVSPSFQFSSTYIRSYRAHNHTDSSHYSLDYTKEIPPLERHNWSCMALCEIIDSPDVYKKHSNDIWTIQDPNLICTRFIFFYPLGLSGGNDLRVDSDLEASPIRKLIHTLNNIAC